MPEFDYKISKCKACGASIVFAFRHIPKEERIDATGKPIGVIDYTQPKPNPINLATSEKGNVFMVDATHYQIILPIDREREPYLGNLHLSHFATCPSKNQFSKRK